MRDAGRCGPRALFEPVAAGAHGMPCPNTTLLTRAGLWESQTPVSNQGSGGEIVILDNIGLLAGPWVVRW